VVERENGIASEIAPSVKWEVAPATSIGIGEKRIDVMTSRRDPSSFVIA